MKDMPAALLVVLSSRDTELMHRVFDRVADNGRVLRTVFQMTRSGQFGRKSLSSSLQRAFQRWLNDASVGKLLSASIGNDPSLRDVLRMARPTPKDDARRALFGWLTEKPVDKWAPATEADLPAAVQSLIAYRGADTAEAQTLIAGELQVRWDLLADAAKGKLVWKAIARQMGPQALRMNLNTLLRHDVFKNGDGKTDNAMIDYVANRLADADEIVRSRQFPYQFLAAYLNASAEVPQKIKASLHQAAEIACGSGQGDGSHEVSRYSTRKTDSAMRRLLTKYGLSTNYVMSPNRCQNIWRALALARLAGLTRSEVCECRSTIVETHPRVAWAILLSNLPSADPLRSIAVFKVADGGNEEGQITARRNMLRHFESATRICPQGEQEEDRIRVRDQAVATADNLESLICAYVAKLHDEGTSQLAGFVDGDSDRLAIEGAAVIPKEAWTIDSDS